MKPTTEINESDFEAEVLKSALAARFDVRSIPVLLYFTDGQARHQTVGAVSKKTIADRLAKFAVAV